MTSFRDDALSAALLRSVSVIYTAATIAYEIDISKQDQSYSEIISKCNRSFGLVLILLVEEVDWLTSETLQYLIQLTS
jgi:hypothetical protein